jgi:hypothetical protein
MTPRAVIVGGIALMAIGCAKGGSSGGDGGGGGASGGAGPGSGGSGGELVCTDAEKCDNACVDLDTDPNNCGACGVTCVVPNAEASCSAGACSLGACTDGFADCDADVNNGCEAEVDCTDGEGCMTACGSTGLLDCTDACAPTCALPAEACNLEDDDCNDVCDDGAIAGCRVGVHRANGPNGHYYGVNQTAIEGLGNTIESLDYFHLYTAAVGGLQPLFRCPKGGGQTFLTTATDCEIGAAPELTLGFISAVADNCGSTPLYRLRNPNNGAHFYTVSAPERDNAINNLGFVNEGVAGHVWAGP